MPTDDPSIFADKFRVSSPRLKNWNYSTLGFYYVTICTLNHNKFFGKIENGKIVLSAKGRIAKEELLKTEIIRPNIKIDSWVIMPNHVHLIVQIKKIINNYNNVETPRRDVSTDKTESHNKNQLLNTHHPEIAIKKWSSNSLGSIINQFKSICTKRIRSQHLFFAWQSRFYDHIIRDKSEYCKIKQYITNNPANWLIDPYHL